MRAEWVKTYGVCYSPRAGEDSPTWGISFALIDKPVLGYVKADSQQEAVTWASEGWGLGMGQPLKAWRLR